MRAPAGHIAPSLFGTGTVPGTSMISTLRSQVGFAAAVAHARLRLSRLELIGSSGRSAGRYASATRAFISRVRRYIPKPFLKRQILAGKQGLLP